LPCHHICIWPAPLLVDTLQCLHWSGAFVDSFFYHRTTIFHSSGAFVVCRAAIWLPSLSVAKPPWFEFDVIHPWLPCRHLTFGQLFDDCCAAPSSSGQHIHQFLYQHQAVALSSRLRDVGVPWHAYNQLPSCCGLIQPVSLLNTLPSFLIQLVHIFILLPCLHLCIWPAPLLVAALQHLH
jgi:hypothetical protein